MKESVLGMVDLTVLIITKNEENNIGKCIRSLRGIAKRIVVVDSFSTDRTAALAKKLGANVYTHPFEDHASQLNWGLENTGITTEWVMRVDADEELTKELTEEIRRKLPRLPKRVTGVMLRRRVYFMGRWIKHGGIYPTYLLRIFRHGKAICEQALMDEHFLLTEGESVRFSKDLIDNNTKDLEWWINKHNWYSNKELEEQLEQRRLLKQANGTADHQSVMKPKLFGGQAERKRWLKYMVYYRTPLMRRAHWYFLYRYIFRLGFLDGPEGLAFHFLQGYWYRFLVDAKIYEHEKLHGTVKKSGALEAES